MSVVALLSRVARAHRARGRPAPWVWSSGLAVMLAAVPAAAQQPVGGVVVDAGTSRPLIGAQVVVQGTTQGTLTDNRGRFLIPNVAGTQATLRVVMIGYRELTRPVVPGRTDLVLELQQTAVSMDEIVVTGTPNQQVKRALGNAVGKVRASELTELAPPPNVQALVSTVPGVRVMSGGGDIGAGGNTRVRGASSMSLGSEPLVYIDGVRVNNAAADQGVVVGVGVDSRYAPSRINDLNPDDIESIEIIKGPAAATLYGTEASNGVINVITKKGRRGAPTVQFSMKQGAAYLPNPEKLFPPVYYKNSQGQIVEFNVLRSDRVTGEYPGDTISYGPWFRTGHPQTYEGSISGATEQLSYYVSGGFDRDEGAVTYNWKNRLNGRANLSYTPSDKVSLDVGLSYVTSRYRTASAQQPITVSILWSCPSPGCEPGLKRPNGVDGPFRGYLTSPPERFNDDIQGYEDLNRGVYNATLRHKPFSWFQHRLTVGADYSQQQLSELYKRTTAVGSGNPNGRKEVENTGTTYTSADYAATASLAPYRDLGLETAVGLQYYRRQRESVYARGDVFPVSELETIASGALKTANEDFVENKTVGAFVQEQASWKNRIFLTGAVRGDDNSAFGKNFDFVVYPKLSASWVLSEEPFFSRLPVNSLKLRAAWGKAGQQPDAFAALRTYDPAAGESGVPTLTPSNLGNADLKPEVGEELELGFDASVLDDRLGVEFTAYNKKTKDALVQVPALPSLGFPGFQYRNIGEVDNRGVEVGVNAEVVRMPNVGLRLGVKYSRNTNEVVDLGGFSSLVLNSFGQYHVPGFPLGSIFHTRVVSADIDRTGPVPKAVNMMCESGEKVPGTNFSRGGGPPVPCAQAPAVYWGSPLPTWEGGVTGTLTLFKNLQVYSQLDFLGGNTILSGDIRASLMSFRNQKAILEATDPILLAYDILDARRQPGIIKGGFAKLREVAATYTVPQGLTRRYGVSRASITVSGQNLWTPWVEQESDFGVRQVDPERRSVAGGGADPGGLTAYFQEGWPQLRRFLTTLRVTL
ncbi:MAG TPA: SusC/RagA family TonB-linked outer membrane protein [Longimicrobiales bacterium]|nr:SusC/RagA family TonB-linked outer membrane protein [Longimicrobiales bacterium]